MKLTQIRDPSGSLAAAISDNGSFRPIPGRTLASLIEQAEQQGRDLPAVASELASSETVKAEPSISRDAGGGLGLRLYLRSERRVPRQRVGRERGPVRLRLRPQEPPGTVLQRDIAGLCRVRRRHRHPSRLELHL